MNFMCSHCDRICEWSTREPVESDTFKTIGGRYCNADACVVAEAKANGVAVERIRRRNLMERMATPRVWVKDAETVAKLGKTMGTVREFMHNKPKGSV